ncbi:MAG: hypothetical protein RMM17_00310 [Acidobacteriota bacterium]|nr:hypothetical protein [Blastocatellia bacterium]MDW8411108.1 hypothetical protein [Acidobacteriota bacterium]
MRVSLKSRFERGYSLLALMMAVAVLSVWLASQVDTYVVDIKREKEEEMIFRGNEIARAIARYNNAGRLAQLRPGPLPMKLEDLTKVTQISGVKQVYLRPYALVNPLEKDGKWRPVRVGDPLLAEYFQNWAAYNSQVVPQEYLMLAGGMNLQLPVGEAQPEDNSWRFSLDDELDSRPIVGVVSYSKAQAYRRLFGKDVTYDKMLFIYMPPVQRFTIDSGKPKDELPPDDEEEDKDGGSSD